jgi:hypothetical protein
MDVLGANRLRRVVCLKRYCGFSTPARNGTCCHRVPAETAQRPTARVILRQGARTVHDSGTAIGDRLEPTRKWMVF